MEFKLRFFGSFLGYLWQLMRPLLMFGVLLFVFTNFIKIGNDVPHYPVVLLLGIVLFQFVGDSIGASVSSVVDRESLVRKIHFPRLVIPCSVVLTAVFSLVLNLVVVVVFAIFEGVGLHKGLLWVPFGLAVLVAYVLGIGMLVSALYVRFRDMRPITDVFLQAYFYATPILYPIESLPRTGQKLMVLLNPFAAVLQQLRHSAITPQIPSASALAGGTVWLLIPLGIVLAILAIGYTVFNRAAPHIAEDL
jgi:ABC-2 type transport system permease protein